MGSIGDKSLGVIQPGAIELSPAERALITFIRQLAYGSVEIKIENGRPTQIERAVEKIRLS